MADRPNPDEHFWTRRSFLHGAAGAAWALGAGRLGPEESTLLRSGRARMIALDRRAELVDLLSRLVAVRSHTGESAEAAQGVVREYLEQRGYRVESSADRPSHFADHPEFMPPNPPGDGPFVNLIGRPSGGRGGRLALFAHIDTEIPRDGWVTDPYQPVIKDGRLYGIGSADDKGGVAAMLVAASALLAEGGPAPVVMSLHGKGGGSRGSLPVFARTRGLDAVLYVHPAETGRGMADVKHVVRGVLDVTLTMRGWRGEPREIGSPDSAPYSDGGDALDACWRAIAHLRRRLPVGADVNVGRMEAGNRVGSVPDEATAAIRILFDGESPWGDLLSGLRRELDAFTATLPRGRGAFRGTIEPTGYRTNAGAVPWDAPSCRVLRRSIESVTGRAPNSYTGHYAGDIRYPIRLLGKPAFGVGSLAGNFYGPNEWVDIDDLVRLVAVVMQTVSGWAAI